MCRDLRGGKGGLRYRDSITFNCMHSPQNWFFANFVALPVDTGYRGVAHTSITCVPFTQEVPLERRFKCGTLVRCLCIPQLPGDDVAFYFPSSFYAWRCPFPFSGNKSRFKNTSRGFPLFSISDSPMRELLQSTTRQKYIGIYFILLFERRKRFIQLLFKWKVKMSEYQKRKLGCVMFGPGKGCTHTCTQYWKGGSPDTCVAKHKQS